MIKKLTAKCSGANGFGIYNSADLAFSFVLPPNKSGVLSFYDNFTRCREILIDDFRVRMNMDHPEEDNAAQPQDDKWVKNNTICTKNACFLVMLKTNKAYSELNAWQKDFYHWINASRHLVNSIEKNKGWKRTQIKEVQPYGGERSISLYWVTGSYHWIKSPQLFSLYLLLIRAMRNRRLRKARTLTEFIYNVNNCKKNDEELHDLKFLDDMDKWLYLLGNDKELYHGRKMSDSYLWSIYNDRGGVNEGVARLTDMGSSDSQLSKRFKKVIKNGKKFID